MLGEEFCLFEAAMQCSDETVWREHLTALVTDGGRTLIQLWNDVARLKGGDLI